MPYANTSEVPDYVPASKKKQWMEAWNSAYESAKGTDAEREASAFRQANGVAGPKTKAGKAAAEAAVAKAVGTDRAATPDEINTAGQLLRYNEFEGIAYGIIASEKLDTDGEHFDYDRSKPLFEAVSAKMADATDGANLFPVWLQHDKHEPVGKVLSFEFDDAKKEIRASVKVVDANAKDLLKEAVVTGFSIGGGYVDQYVKDKKKWYVVQPREISLVDMPANPDSTFEYVRAAGGAVEVRKFAKVVAKSLEPGEDDSYEEEIREVYAAVAEKFPKTGCSCSCQPCSCCQYWVIETYPDRVIVCESDTQEYFSISYTEDEATESFSFGTPIPVEKEWVPESPEVSEMKAAKSAIDTFLTEFADYRTPIVDALDALEKVLEPKMTQEELTKMSKSIADHLAKAKDMVSAHHEAMQAHLDKCAKMVGPAEDKPADKAADVIVAPPVAAPTPVAEIAKAEKPLTREDVAEIVTATFEKMLGEEIEAPAPQPKPILNTAHATKTVEKGATETAQPDLKALGKAAASGDQDAILALMKSAKAL